MNRYLVLTILFLFSFDAKAQKLTAAEKAEDSAYAVVEAIPEIQELIKNDTDKVWKFSMRTIRVPGYYFKYYWLQVGKESGPKFVSQLDFYVDPKTFDVLVLDTKTNKTLTLKQLREMDMQRH